MAKEQYHYGCTDVRLLKCWFDSAQLVAVVVPREAVAKRHKNYDLQCLH